MTLLNLSVDERWLASIGLSEAEAQRELRLVLAAKLYELGRVTLGQAAGMASLSQWAFCEALPRLGVSIVNTTEEHLRDELR